MKLFLIIVVSLTLCLPSTGQDIEIPEIIYFAGMRLQLNNAVRRTLKTEVSNLRRNEKYFQMKVDRADLYFPIIEKVFKEEDCPDDFKYLALQESSLVADAVSSSNAVGYWQFKKESAQEVGLRIDHVVDERMNIVAASRGAAKYLKRNNAVLKNWIYALLSYNLGLGGVKKEVDEKYVGATNMKISDNMHWYVVRFLAHKLAFENAVGRSSGRDLRLFEYDRCQNKSLKEISKETDVAYEDILAYNKWALRESIPDDKPYIVILPVKKVQEEAILARLKGQQSVIVQAGNNSHDKKNSSRKRKPEQRSESGGSVNPDIIITTNHNKLKAVLAKEGDTFEKMAISGGIQITDILLYNEVKRYESPKPGVYYYLQPKRNKALISEHITKPGETLWQIGQMYGIRTAAIRKKNRMKLKEEPVEGRVLQLRKRLGKTETPKIVKPAQPQVSKPVPAAVIKDQSPAPVQPSNPNPADTQEEAEPVDVFVIKNTSGTGKVKYHQVQQGETLYGISKAYGTIVDSLLKWNPGISSQGLKAGSEIVVGSTEESNNITEKYHIVTQGETLYKIARQYGLSVEELMKINGKQDFNVAVGEKLKIDSE